MFAVSKNRQYFIGVGISNGTERMASSKPNLKLLEIFLKSAEPFGKRETRSLNHLRPIFSRKVGLYTISCSGTEDFSL